MDAAAIRAGRFHRHAGGNADRVSMVRTEPRDPSRAGSRCAHRDQARFRRRDPLITHMTLALRDELDAGNPGGRVYGEMLGAALKAHFVRRQAVFGIRRSPARGDAGRNRMGAVLESISARLHESISLMDLAAVAGVGVFQFAHAFKRRIGMPPHQYLLRKRVERAIALMRDPEKTIADIALSCSF